MLHRFLPIRIVRNEDGAAVVEFAFAMPILLMFIWGISQFGMIMAADASMQHALGEGARMATIFPTPSNALVKQRMEQSTYGPFLGQYTVADPVTSTATTIGNRFVDLSISYTVTPDFLFWQAAPITMTRTKRVYVAF